jgi:hypothetical protein
MQQMLPRMALTGFDHTMFFLTGLQKYGKDFNGEKGQSAVKAVQTPLSFERIGNGGLRNRTLLMVNYQPEQRISVISK